ncbi:MAG: phosphotransferase family protein [Candidatus Limnocylindrales bacterium]
MAFPNDGWSGSTLTALDRGDTRFILKRTSPEADWIVRATRDIGLREGFIAGTGLRLAEPLVAPYLGAGSDGPSIAMLMPDLTNELIAWDRPGHDPVVGPATLDHVIEAIAGLHAMPWADYRPTTPDWGWPWCPLRERLLLLTRPSAEGYRAEGLAVGDRFLAGWDAFDRLAPLEARTLIAGLSEDPAPLLEALGRLPATGIHGDLKLANVALLDDGRVGLIDWQMMTLAPVAVELAWMLVSNSASLPLEPEAVMARYRETAARTARSSLRLGARFADGDPAGTSSLTLPPRGPERTIGDWDAQRDLTWIVGLLLRGWRKALDAEADVVLGSGVRATHDLAWWSAQAVESAGRRLP